jgi:hypothetical protein
MIMLPAPIKPFIPTRWRAGFIALAAVLFTPITASLLHAKTPAPNPAIRVQVKGLSQPQKLTLLAAQGLSNRNGPNVYLDFGLDNTWMGMAYVEKKPHLQSWNPETTEAFKTKYPTITEAWIDTWDTGGYFRFTSQPWESFLIQAGKIAKGWIVYDNFDNEVALAGTLAGLMDAACFTQRSSGHGKSLAGPARGF